MAQLSLPQRTQVAKDIARFIGQLAINTSPRFQTISGYGIREPWLQGKAYASHPTWLPRLLGPFSLEEMRANMERISTEPPPAIDPVFHFYHADLGPTNVMVMQDGTVSGIIDWESAAYYPQFWVATKTSLPAFHLECETDDPTLWGQLLGQALEVCGYKRLDAEFRRWVKAVT
jgi:Ser/Thr protein kinase RdoA (MazF antagonist)